MTTYSQVIEITSDTVDYALSGSSSYKITARPSLILGPGFSYSPTPGNSLSATANPIPYIHTVSPELQGSTLSADPLKKLGYGRLVLQTHYKVPDIIYPENYIKIL